MLNTFLKKYFATIKRFLPEKAEVTSVGLDIGSQNCRLVELRFKDNQYEIVQAVIEPVINGDTKGALKKLWDGHDLSHKSVYTSILGKGTLIRFIEMPKMTNEELRSSFSLEAEKYFPFDLEQIYTDCYIIDAKTKQKKMPVLIAAAKKDLIDRRIQLLKDVGGQADFVGFNILALANVIKTTDYTTEDFDASLAVLEIEDQVSSLMITTDKVPCFNRDIFLGAKEIKQSIANSLGKSAADVTALLAESRDSSDVMADACDLAVENIVRELEMSFDYFSTEGNKEVKEIMLFGEISQYPPIKKALEKNLEIKIVPWDPLKAVTLSDQVTKDEIIQNANQLGVAIGLALNEYD
jgi:type IV pilus assembly protein PilM